MRLIPLPLFALGCAPELGVIHQWDNGDDVAITDTGFETGPKVTTESRGDGVWWTEVDAQDGLVWAAVDLDMQGAELLDSDPGWDLKFQRFEVAVNGGVTGEGGVEAVFFEDMGLADLTVPPTEGWGSDLPDGDDENDLPDFVFRPWFDYDGATHIVTANPGVFAVRSTDDKYYAVEMQSYYDAAGTSAVISFLWKPMNPP